MAENVFKVIELVGQERSFNPSEANRHEGQKTARNGRSLSNNHLWWAVICSSDKLGKRAAVPSKISALWSALRKSVDWIASTTTLLVSGQTI